MRNDFKNIEKKWQARWDAEKAFHAEDKSDKKKFYALVEFHARRTHKGLFGT